MKYICKRKMLFLVCVLLLCSQMQAKITPRVPEKLYVGELIPIEIDMTDRQPEIVSVKRDGQSILHISEVIEIKDKPWQYMLYVAPFDTGYVDTEPIPLFAMKDARVDTFFVPAMRFFVQTSLTPADTTHKDIAGLHSLNFWKDINHTIPIVALILLGLLLIFLPKLLRLLKKPEAEAVIVDNRPPWMVALELLQKFKQKMLLENGLYLDYYFELSLIFRFFIERQHRIKAVEMTTYEIKQALSELPEKREIVRILSDMDKIKFAKFIPSEKEAQDCLYWIEKYIMSFVNEPSRDAINSVSDNETEQSHTTTSGDDIYSVSTSEADNSEADDV